MDQGSEQNRTEEATPFKLKRAREKGVVARGIDLGFFSVLSAFAVFAVVAGQSALDHLAQVMRLSYGSIGAVDGSGEALAQAIPKFWPAFQPVALLGATVMVLAALFEIIQIRGVVFSAAPLKPDFSRLNPAKGLKRLFSARMLKETLKSVVKFLLYAGTAFVILRQAFDGWTGAIGDAATLAGALKAEGFRLLFAFLVLALIFAAIDQVIARGDFAKQMRMSRSELTREHREREGEPRLKQKRRQLHASFAKQARGLGDLSGTDLMIVNPEHYAVALAYDANTMEAPRVTAKGRNHFAQLLKRRAYDLNLAVFEHPELARALYAKCDKNQDIPGEHYRAVAELYLKLPNRRTSPHALKS